MNQDKEVYRKGNIQLRVIGARLDGKRLLRIGKGDESKSSIQPLFTEAELDDVLDVLDDFGLKRIVVKRRQEIAYREIMNAISAVQRIDDKNDERTKSKLITPIKTMPDFEYVHTCPSCGSHVVRRFSISNSISIVSCPGCDRVHRVIN